MRWFVEVSPLRSSAAGSTPSVDTLVVDARAWQAALQTAREMGGSGGPISQFSIELLPDGYRAVDPVARVRYVIRRAPDDTPLTGASAPGSPTGGGALAPSAAPPAAKEPAAQASASPPGAPSSLGASPLATSTSLSPAAAPAGQPSASPSSAPPRPTSPPRPLSIPPPAAASVIPSTVPSRVAPAAAPPSDLVRHEVLLSREEQPSASSPLTYREYVYVVPHGTTEAAAERLIRMCFLEVSTQLSAVGPGKFVNLAVFDVVFTGKPPKPPLVTLTWKDWRGPAPELRFPAQERRATVPPISRSAPPPEFTPPPAAAVSSIQPVQTVPVLAAVAAPAAAWTATVPAARAPEGGEAGRSQPAAHRAAPPAAEPEVITRGATALAPSASAEVEEVEVEIEVAPVPPPVPRRDSASRLRAAPLQVVGAAASPPLAEGPRHASERPTTPSPQPTVPPRADPLDGPGVPVVAAAAPQPPAAPAVEVVAPQPQVSAAAPLPAAATEPGEGLVLTERCEPPASIASAPPAGAGPLGPSPAVPERAPGANPGQEAGAGSDPFAPASSGTMTERDPFSAPPAELPARAPSPDSAPASEPALSGPNGPSLDARGKTVDRNKKRLSGDDLLGDLFESLHDLHFLGGSLEGAHFVLSLAVEKLPCQIAVCHFYDINRREFVVAHALGRPREALLLRRTPEREPLVTQTMRRRRAVVIGDARADERTRGGRWEAMGPLWSVVSAPVSLGGRFLGLLELANPVDGGAFVEGDGYALSYIGEQFAEFLAQIGTTLDPEQIRAFRPAKAR